MLARKMRHLRSTILWIVVAALGATAFAVLAQSRGESINAAWILVAGVASYVVAYRFYSRYLALRVFALDDRRATPAERLNNGRDFVPTNKWVLYGHHFAAIAGAGPLIGPMLAAQFGFLPGTLWLIAGVVVGGAVQDFTILFASMRRDGKSLGQMAKEEVNSVAGMAAMVAILAIMIILLAVLALVVVNALRASPWGLFIIASTIPIAMLMGVWMRSFRPGHVLEASAIGIALLLAAPASGSRATRRGAAGSPGRARSCRGASSSTDSWPRRSRSGCCSPPAATCPRSSRSGRSSRSPSPSCWCCPRPGCPR